MSAIRNSAFKRPFGFLARLLGDEGGAAFLYVSVVLTALLGVVGLSVDMGTWYLLRREAQVTADAGAVAGALEILRSGDSTAVTQAATNDATSNGHATTAGDVLEIHFPPSSGSYSGAGDAVEVVVRKASPSFFTAPFLSDSATIAARAVAVAEVNDTCVWALDPSSKSALKVAGGANVGFGCGIVVNSTDAEALTQSGTTSCLTATKVKVVGGASGDCIQPEAMEGVRPVADPLASMQPPAVGGCDHNAKIKVNSGGSLTLDPGVYCKAIEVSAGGTLHFNPGYYVLKGGLSVASSSTVTGYGVTFYLPDTTGPADSISIAGQADVTLVAAETGPLPGFLFFQDRNAAANVNHSLAGGSSMHLEGIIYFPNQNLAFSGGSSTDASAAMIVAHTVSFTGQSYLGNFDGSAVQANTTLIQAKLVE